MPASVVKTFLLLSSSYDFANCVCAYLKDSFQLKASFHIVNSKSLFQFYFFFTAGSLKYFVDRLASV